MECNTNVCDAAMLKNLVRVSEIPRVASSLKTHLGIMSVHKVDLDVLFLNISLEIVDKWCISRRSVLDKACHWGCGYT
jgi:hypothetical protein